MFTWKLFHFIDKTAGVVEIKKKWSYGAIISIDQSTTFYFKWGPRFRLSCIVGKSHMISFKLIAWNLYLAHGTVANFWISQFKVYENWIKLIHLFSWAEFELTPIWIREIQLILRTVIVHTVKENCISVYYIIHRNPYILEEVFNNKLNNKAFL